MDTAPRKQPDGHPRFRFDRDIIGELRRLATAHNEATPDPARHVKTGQLKGLYKRYHNGKDPHAHALAKLDEHLERLRRQGEVPAPVKVNAVLSPDDFLGALEIAGIAAHPGEPALSEAAATVCSVAQRVVSAPFLPAIGRIREAGDALEGIQSACLSVFSLGRLQPPGALSDGNVPDVLARQLSRSRNPVVIALLDAAGGDAGGRPLAGALLEIARLASWSGAAREQFGAGLKREKVSREDPAARSPARALGFALIESYVSLSGKNPGFSRVKPESGGKPAGPLIRYLRHLFYRARHHLSLDPGRTALQQRREWNPSPETLAAWIQQFRAGGPDL